MLNSYLLSWNRPIYGGALLGVETGLDPGNRFHEIEIQTESVGSALDLLDRRSDRVSLNELKMRSAGFLAGGSSDQT